MTKLIDLGRVSDETKGSAFNTTLVDSPAQKINEGGTLYNSAPPAVADGFRQENDQ